MIGRAAPANPWIFRQIAQYTATGRYDEPTEQDRYRMIRTYFTMLLDEGPQAEGQRNEATADEHADAAKASRENAGKMKQFASWFTHGVPGGAALRKAIYEARTGTQILDAVERFFEGRLDTGPVEPEALMLAGR
jgi:tRNA-dihydrouridine synthase B